MASPADSERRPSGRSKDRIPGWSDETMDLVISVLLRLGLALSAVLVLAGGIIFLVRHGGDIVSYRVFQGEPPSYRYLPGILQEALHIRGRGLILAGLIILIATPVARVAVSVVSFLFRRDSVYVLVTIIVLAVLLFSLFIA